MEFMEGPLSPEVKYWVFPCILEQLVLCLQRHYVSGPLSIRVCVQLSICDLHTSHKNV